MSVMSVCECVGFCAWEFCEASLKEDAPVIPATSQFVQQRTGAINHGGFSCFLGVLCSPRAQKWFGGATNQQTLHVELSWRFTEAASSRCSPLTSLPAS